MNQKNVFTALSAVSILYSLTYYFMSDTLAANGTPNLDQAGQNAVSNLLQVCGVLGIGKAILYYATRNTPSIAWAFCLSSGLFLLNTLKHKFIDHENPPVTAIVFQAVLFLAVAYVWIQDRRSSTLETKATN